MWSSKRPRYCPLACFFVPACQIPLLADVCKGRGTHAPHGRDRQDEAMRTGRGSDPGRRTGGFCFARAAIGGTKDAFARIPAPAAAARSKTFRFSANAKMSREKRRNFHTRTRHFGCCAPHARAPYPRPSMGFLRPLTGR